MAKDPLGSQSPYLGMILRTHWIRTALINGYASFLLFATIAALRS
jgi:hypothetical protein